MELVRTQGPNNWVRISQQLQHRSPKQCRERYHQNLKPSLNHEPISAHEGEMIEQMVHEMGKRWAEIARRLGNRSDNAVKNWWNGSMNRRKRNPTQHSGLKHLGNRLHPIPMSSPERPNYVDLPALPPFQHPNRSAANLQTIRRWHIDPNEIRPISLCTPEITYDHSPTTSFFASRALPLTHSAPPDSNPSRQGSGLASLRSYDERMGEARSHLAPLRLPLPRGSHTELPSPIFPGDRPMVSPAISDVSQALSVRQEPSLISDTHSSYSVSPRTVHSPRSAMPSSTDFGSQTWHSQPHEAQPYRYHSNTSSIQSDDLMSPALPHQNASETKFPPLHYNSSLPDYRSQSESFDQPGLLGKVESPRDTRMHVSSLLE